MNRYFIIIILPLQKDYFRYSIREIRNNIQCPLKIFLRGHDQDKIAKILAVLMTIIFRLFPTRNGKKRKGLRTSFFYICVI